MMNEGYKFFANKKLITIFSAPCYMGETKNRGAVLRVTVTGVVSVVEMRDSRPMKKTTDQKVFEDEVTRGVDDKPPSESAKTGKLNSSSSSKSNSESQ
uniref:Uncharacterized protein n=1 Tax=Caenorhabditis japonica TaxID=281687 RepID=A0A8R1IQ42_CAEJA